jgi:chromosomal replication initiator protein
VPTQPDEIWDSIRAELRRETPDFKFHIWLDPLRLAAIRGETVFIRAPDHIRTSVTERYLPLLRRAASTAFEERALVEVVGEDWEAPPDGGTEQSRMPRDGRPGAGTLAERERLNQKYTFDQFVIGAGNRFAHAASLAVAELPGHSYNPLFLHGSPGIGKTHLLHAIGNYVARFGAGLRVRYATVDEFTAEFVQAVKSGEPADFKQSFRGADVVLIDDVQFLAGRHKTREEFFHTFNALVEAGRQLVMTSDSAPEDIPGLEERLTQRFRSGLVVELDTPEVSARLAILAKRAHLDGIEVGDEVLEEIAARVTTSVRALEGALIRVVAFGSLTGRPCTAELAAEVLAGLYPELTPRARSLREIQELTCEAFGVSMDQLLSPSRAQPLAWPRQVAMYLARELTDATLPAIGRAFGGRNHTTVLHAYRKTAERIANDRDAYETVRRLTETLGGR